MICKNPYIKHGLSFGCGQCLPCRINRRRLWTHRLMLEALDHADSIFVTLTYSPENLPADGSLQPRDTQLFLKRLRKALHPRKIRYYLVGEYGEQTFRAHYHLVLYGCSESDSPTISDAWNLGRIHVGSVTFASCAYVASYVTKKMTSKDDPRLNGRHPEFARMSLRPGIGAEAMEKVAASFRDGPGADFLTLNGDVPLSIKYGNKQFPLGRYLRTILRELLNVEKPEIDSSLFDKAREEMSSMLSDSARRRLSRKGQGQVVAWHNRQKIRNTESRYKLYAKSEKL